MITVIAIMLAPIFIIDVIIHAWQGKPYGSK